MYIIKKELGMTLVKKQKAGRPRISSKMQQEILALVKEGYTYKSIAEHLSISLRTVQAYSKARK